jgi:hypothetical protein
MTGVRTFSRSECVITAKVPRALAELLRDEARANYSTVSGEVRRLLVEKFGRAVVT